MKSELLKIFCLTNLHVGSGETNFNIIDKEVEKDPVTKIPIIFASGVKGAFKEHTFTIGMSEDMIFTIFGSDSKVRKNTTNKLEKSNVSNNNTTAENETIDSQKSTLENYNSPGNVKFLTAQMLAMPMRASMGKKSFYMITTKTMLIQFFNLYNSIIDNKEDIFKEIEALDSDKSYYLAKESHEKIEVEGILIKDPLPSKSSPSKLKEFIRNSIAKDAIILPDNALREISLPILARNQLENGISKNLWYEEVVPHDSIFYTFLLSNGTSSGDTGLKTLINRLSSNSLIQFGGNATIGCGLTKVERWELK